MNKKEISAVKKALSPEKGAASRFYCMGTKNKAFSAVELGMLGEEERDLCMALFKKALSGKTGKNLVPVSFPVEQEAEGGTQERLISLLGGDKEEEGYKALASELADAYGDDDSVVMILPGSFDIPGTDNIYSFILCAICPAASTKPVLSYDGASISGTKKVTALGAPSCGFLFPSYTDGQPDVHNALVYAKKPASMPDAVIEKILGCHVPVTADEQKEAFSSLVENLLGSGCDYQTVRAIQDNLAEALEESASPDLLEYTKSDIQRLFEASGVPERVLEGFDDAYEEAVGDIRALTVGNLVDAKITVRTSDVAVTADSGKAGSVTAVMVNGRKCLAVPFEGEVTVNGVRIR